MGFEFLDILFVFGGIYLAIILVWILDGFRKRRKKPDYEAEMRRLALTEGVIWLAPVINYSLKCKLLLEDFRNGGVSDIALAEAWPKINLKELKTEKGKESMPWLPADIFQRGMNLIASLDYIILLLPAAVLNSAEIEERINILNDYITRLSLLYEKFLDLDLELRRQIAVIGRDKK